MNKFNRVLLALPLMALAILPARAQVTIDVSKITCEQYVLFHGGRSARHRDVAERLLQRQDATTPSSTPRNSGSTRKKVMDYCQLNLKTTGHGSGRRKCWG